MKIGPDRRRGPDLRALLLGVSVVACSAEAPPPPPPPVSLALRVATAIREGDTSYEMLSRPEIVALLALPGELSLAAERPLPTDMAIPPGAELFDGRLFVDGQRASEVTSWPAPPGSRFMPACVAYEGGTWRCHAMLLEGPFLPPSEILQVTHTTRDSGHSVMVRFSEKGERCFSKLLDDNPSQFLAFVRLDAVAAEAMGGPMQDCGAPP